MAVNLSTSHALGRHTPARPDGAKWRRKPDASSEREMLNDFGHSQEGALIGAVLIVV